MGKLKSRKLWLSIAALLGSVAAAIAGFATDNQMVILVGVVCGVVSTSIYTLAEALIDCERVEEAAEDDYEEAEATREVVSYSYGTDGTVIFRYDDGTTETFRKE